MKTTKVIKRGLPVASLSVLAAAGSFVALALAGPAKDARIEASRFFPLEGDAQPTGRSVDCPSGTRAVGGGAVQSGSAENLETQGNGPLDGTGRAAATRDGDRAKRWRASLSRTGAPDRQFKVMALCSAASDARIEATRFEVGAHLGEEAAAVCPAGQRALGGGVLPIGPAQNVRIGFSGPLDAGGVTLDTVDGDKPKQWYAAAVNFSELGTDPVALKVFALCSADSKATIEASELQTLPDEASEATAEAYAKCPSGTLATGGGMVQSGEFAGAPAMGASGPLEASGVTAETRDGDVARWWYAVLRSSFGWDFKVFAICEPR